MFGFAESFGESIEGVWLQLEVRVLNSLHVPEEFSLLKREN